MKVLGLDISTSCIGVSVVSLVDGGEVNLEVLSHIKMSSKKTTWEKIDDVRVFFQAFKIENPHITHIFVEDAMMRFQPGMSSATTISTLLRFNALTSYVVRDTYEINPEFISVNHARKECGIKTQRVSKCGKSHKIQVFEHITANDLKSHSWPTKKNSVNIVDWAYDEVDSYVIAKAGLLVVNSRSE